MEPAIFYIFFATTFAVVLSPGPAAICVASQGSANGWKRAFAGTLGVASANVAYFVLSATGIAALILASHLLFSIIKWCGIAYLIYLGISAFTSHGGLQIKTGDKKSRRKLFSQGFIVEFANPKALLYFAAILPQFINVTNPILPQILIMGLVTVCIDLTIYSVYGVAGDRIAKSGIKARGVRILNSIAGTALLVAAVKMISVSSKQA